MRITTKSISTRLWLVILFITVCSSPIVAQATEPADKEDEVLAILWQQSSGEHRALCYQAYALARMLLDRDLRNHRVRMRRAIIVDLDETVWDTSAYEAMNVKQRTNYPEGWVEWMNRAQATAIPGAVEFLNYANTRGVRIFYVTNRKPVGKEGTAQNLKKLGFPAVNDESLLMRDDPAIESKTARRKAISAKYHVVLLMGDDLNDFDDVFEKSKTIASRIEATDRNKSEFGTRFVVLPNPMYGNWANSLYEYNFKLTEQQKAALRRALLRD
ncbi:MAG TPA: 5'-nucleotidase, lipoprotein e(P4) family [Pyrinomonadaceae bacterium]|nr:5'-nucleotidase, lipoprotein e(P4) family [Pyrinomonadaceae bacterium]